jgi:hypothetical protein
VSRNDRAVAPDAKGKLDAIRSDEEFDEKYGSE